MRKCPICQKEFKAIRAKHCSQSCRCKSYYLKNREKEIEKKTKLYYKNKKENYERLREINKKASKKYKEKNIEKVREANREYQRRTKQSIIFHDKSKFNGKRLAVLKRDKFMCCECGSKEKLVIHHKDGSGKSKKINNSLKNLITLCRKCHINIHRNDL